MYFFYYLPRFFPELRGKDIHDISPCQSLRKDFPICVKCVVNLKETWTWMKLRAWSAKESFIFECQNENVIILLSSDDSSEKITWQLMQKYHNYFVFSFSVSRADIYVCIIYTIVFMLLWNAKSNIYRVEWNYSTHFADNFLSSCELGLNKDYDVSRDAVVMYEKHDPRTY